MMLSFLIMVRGLRDLSQKEGVKVSVLLQDLKKKKKMELNKEEATKQLHFDILNTVLKIIDKCWYYCFCKKYQGCEWFDGGQSFCPRFKICFDFKDIENRCNFPQFKFDELMTI